MRIEELIFQAFQQFRKDDTEISLTHPVTKKIIKIQQSKAEPILMATIRAQKSSRKYRRSQLKMISRYSPVG